MSPERAGLEEHYLRNQLITTALTTRKAGVAWDLLPSALLIQTRSPGRIEHLSPKSTGIVFLNGPTASMGVGGQADACLRLQFAVASPCRTWLAGSRPMERRRGSPH